ncbi:MAG: bifunctional 2-C-methyl-D-erythritol 4-phosphate cytidylyltransferase/2-C-methyl-D-erythritol 2,4-cyclodiphosphate synthase [Paracoccaceae bacterium]|nr:bifunctional 2-C-methyl-D-erythritol 4-phosphate cytidylyltransferase/2-C-methyl-D-erythritol 2,4-cyclodiphosphate synthase [Paracoccaceae bacterium]
MIDNTKKSNVIIVAAGTGSRVGGPLPKQYQEINGTPILAITTNRFLTMPEIQRTIVVINKNHQEYFDTKVLPFLKGTVELTYGGKLRQDSVLQGLKQLPSDELVLIHDGARPFVSKNLIKTIIKQTREHGAAAPGLKITDTPWKVEKSLVVAGVNRTNLYNAQTPQGFYKRDIFTFYNKMDESKTDDVGLAIKNGLTVKFVKGEENNKKITTMADMMSYNTGQNIHTEFRTGIGYDVHAFEKGQTIILCGIKIPYKYSLMGHSDADVSMHAITDALYGAIAEGDIGTWFPPNEPEWKNKNSEIFLEHSKNLLSNRGFLISNIDCTIICEEPKITPHVKKMKDNIARILDIEKQRISIKATTSEKLGFIGRKEGIATQAIATVKKID